MPGNPALGQAGRQAGWPWPLALARDLALAQAILDGAGISLPGGSLSECYDEWGTR